ncbi:MAG TPA: DinB family protein [Gemmatimonadaceae bacterium]|nr:DinB family protein [Gemmatimonadaceae bacterium]
MLPSAGKLAGLMDDHRAAADEFFHRAAQVTSARWDAPRADGKWTPAEEVMHVVLAYETFTGELAGGGGVRLVGTPLKRLFWRAVGLTSVLLLRKLPRGARSPREIRPPPGPHDQAELLAHLREATTKFEEMFRSTWERAPRRTVNHPYFGALDLEDSIRTVTVHTRHHAAVLPPPGARQQVGA